jgi:methionyl-tRNA formyltransferase
MYSKILIISDNSYSHHFTYSISPYSNIAEFGTEHFSIFDLKSPKDLDFILGNFDLVFSLHCKQIFPKELVNGLKCINIHPGYNPVNRGWYPQIFSILNDLPVGATIHEIDEALDHGGIIARSLVPKYSYDTSKTLYDRILEKEIELLYNYLPSILNNSYELTHPENEGNLFLKKDFNSLLEIDLNQEYRAKDLIDKLRALTHGGYKNAYFIDPATGDKIYIGIELQKE